MHPDDAEIGYALESLCKRQRRYRTYANYYEGLQPLSFSTDQWTNAFGTLFKKLAYNRCKSVVDSYANRLTITGWETPGIAEGATDALGAQAQTLWDRTRMVKRQGEVWVEAMRSGDAYLIVWPDDEGLARIDLNRGSLIEPAYDDEYPEQLTSAVKCWQVGSGQDRGKWRVTVYSAELITRWITRSATDERPEKFTAFVPYGDQAEVVNDYGVIPVFHLGHNADTGCTGRSVLSGVLPLQDGLNKSIADMLIAGEYVSFPQRWVVGAAPVTNPFTNQEEEQFKAAVDRVWAVDNEAARFGQFDSANMTQYIDQQVAWDQKISHVSSVPMHWLGMSGDFPSGEALKTAEGPFTAEVKGDQIAFGDTMGAAVAFALHVESGSPLDTMVSPIWQPAETRSEMEALNQAAMKRALGVPDVQIWRELSYSDQEIKEFTKIKQDALAQQQQAFATSFDRGNVPIGGQ